MKKGKKIFGGTLGLVVVFIAGVFLSDQVKPMLAKVPMLDKLLTPKTVA